MELVWCSNCRADVSLAHAVAEMPCPACGGREYFVAADDGSADALLFKAERMMRLGRWSEAAAAFRACFEMGLISAAEFNLSSANLEWRRQCAAAAVDLVACGGIRLDAFRGALSAEFDEYVVKWLLKEYRGIRLVPDGKSYIVEGC